MLKLHYCDFISGEVILRRIACSAIPADLFTKHLTQSQTRQALCLRRVVQFQVDPLILMRRSSKLAGWSVTLLLPRWECVSCSISSSAPRAGREAPTPPAVTSVAGAAEALRDPQPLCCHVQVTQMCCFDFSSVWLCHS